MDNIREKLNQIRNILASDDLNDYKDKLENLVTDIENISDGLEELNNSIIRDLKTDLENVESTINSHTTRINDILY